jgi:hypothetical protein
MKIAASIFLLGFWLTAQGQQVTKSINISPGENAVGTSLPFDRPIILKWTSKETINVEYVGLQYITGGDVSKQYHEYAQGQSFYDMQGTTITSGVLTLKDEKLNSNLSVNADGKFELNIFLPPLKPRMFYDVKILRRPLDAEAGLYYEFFNYLRLADRNGQRNILSQINALKKRYLHDPSDMGQLTAFYTVFLKSIYDELAAFTDKDKIADAKARIRAKIMLFKPISGYEQVGLYFKAFQAIEDGSDIDLKTAILSINTAQKGYLKDPPDAEHIGSFSMDAVKRIYLSGSGFRSGYAAYKAALDAEKIAKQSAMVKMIATQLPMADDMFIFGQTLSSTTNVLDFDTRTGYTITPDFGYVYYGFQDNFSAMTPYIGFQLEFRYFDKNIPFNMIHPKSIWHYLSFCSGVTMTSLKKEGKRDDLFAGKSLLMGLGVRLSSATRITFGGILFNKEDVNPLKDNKHTIATPFIGISIDLKLKSIISDLVGLSPTIKP